MGAAYQISTVLCRNYLKSPESFIKTEMFITTDIIEIRYIYTNDYRSTRSNMLQYCRAPE